MKESRKDAYGFLLPGLVKAMKITAIKQAENAVNIQAAENRGSLEGRAKAKDYTGKIINGYVVLYPMKQKAKNRLILWRVQCIYCQHEKTLRSDQLSAGRMPTCPCRGGVARREAAKEAQPAFQDESKKERLA